MYSNSTYSFSNIFGRKKLVSIALIAGCFSSSASTPSVQADSPNKNLPSFSISEGVMSFVGDVGYSHLNQPLFTRSALQFEVQKEIRSGFSFSLFLLSGKVYGDENSSIRNLNFESGIVSEGIRFRYDFICKKNQPQTIIPFVSAGIEYVVFHPKADLKDENGNYYHYWKDGSIRSIAESDSNASQAVIVHRDYNYETELSDANIDGHGTFKESAIALPVGVGVKFRISGRCSMDLSSVCHFTNTDFIDGVNSESTGSRKGNAMNDKFIYSSVSFRYDFSAPRDTPKKIHEDKLKPKIDVTNVDFSKLENEDSDHDGVPDIIDEDPNTPPNVQVDSKGRPLDTDGDGIPDYLDDEPHSASGALVNEKGVTITDEMIEDQMMRDSLAALPAIKEYLKSMDDLSTPSVAPATNKPGAKNAIPQLYQKVDTDNNGIISSKEISKAIDEYMDGKSSYSSDEFYRLIDFFFKQH